MACSGEGGVLNPVFEIGDEVEVRMRDRWVRGVVRVVFRGMLPGVISGYRVHVDELSLDTFVTDRSIRKVEA